MPGRKGQNPKRTGNKKPKGNKPRQNKVNNTLETAKFSELITDEQKAKFGSFEVNALAKSLNVTSAAEPEVVVGNLDDEKVILSRAQKNKFLQQVAASKLLKETEFHIDSRDWTELKELITDSHTNRAETVWNLTGPRVGQRLGTTVHVPFTTQELLRNLRHRRIRREDSKPEQFVIVRPIEENTEKARELRLFLEKISLEVVKKD